MMNQTIYKIRTIAAAFGLFAATLSGAYAQGTTPQTIEFTSPSEGTRNFPITLAATASSGLEVTFAIESQMPANVATLSNGVLTLDNVGTVVITATQAGDATYAEATATQTIRVRFGTAINFLTPVNNIRNARIGEAYGLSARTTQSFPLSFSIDNPDIARLTSLGNIGATYNVEVTMLAVGTVTVTASHAGSDTHSPNSESRTITVPQGTTAQRITASFVPPRQTVGNIATLSGTSDSGLTVRWELEDLVFAANFATLRDARDGTATLEYHAVGSIVIRPSQAGDDTYAPAQGQDRPSILVKAHKPSSFVLSEAR